MLSISQNPSGTMRAINGEFSLGSSPDLNALNLDVLTINIDGNSFHILDVPNSPPPELHGDVKSWNWTGTNGRDGYHIEVDPQGMVVFSARLRGTFTSLAPLIDKPALALLTPVGGPQASYSVGSFQSPGSAQVVTWL